MSIRDLIMVFEVHIKEQVHSISYQTKLKPMCLVYTANYKHAYCMYKTYNYIIHMYVCFTRKKTCVNKDFTVTVVVHWQSCLPEISVMAGKGGHRLSRFKKSAGHRAVNDGNTSLLIQSWPTLCEKKKLKYIHLKCYNDVIQKYCYTVIISF